MASVNSNYDAQTDSVPRVRSIGMADLTDALRLGLADFQAMPTYSVFLIVIYPVVGLFLMWLSFGYNLMHFAFPLIAGFALLGPLAAIGLYEISRRREQGLDFSWAALDVFSLLRIRSIAVLGLVLFGIFFLWLAAAEAVWRGSFGEWSPPNAAEFASRVLTTQAGWELILVGCGVGFVFALVAFVISAVSFPLLVDRDVGAAKAVITSVRAVAANPLTMAAWGLIVSGALLLGSLPAFIGLAVVLPVLGHATWHLYRKLVAH